MKIVTENKYTCMIANVVLVVIQNFQILGIKCENSFGE